MLSKLLGGSLVDTVGKVIDSVHTSEEEKLTARNKLKELENEINSKQMDINLADAKSTATGIGGIMQRSWRPLIGMSQPCSEWPAFAASKNLKKLQNDHLHKMSMCLSL